LHASKVNGYVDDTIPGIIEMWSEVSYSQKSRAINDTQTLIMDEIYVECEILFCGRRKNGQTGLRKLVLLSPLAHRLAVCR
jgi:hypothetical protein